MRVGVIRGGGRGGMLLAFCMHMYLGTFLSVDFSSLVFLLF